MATGELRTDTDEGGTPSNGVLIHEGYSRLCQICSVEKSTDTFVTFSNCGHTFCSDCVRQAFHYKVSETRVKLQCLQCSSAVTQRELEQICDGELYQRYLDACLNRHLATTPNIRYCPAPDCTFACIDTSTAVSSTVVEEHFVCHRDECGREFCNTCRQPWHEGKTCQQVHEELPQDRRQLTDEIERIEVEIIKKTKECPRCHNKIEKMKDTCNMVTCWYCDLNFCWLCGREVNEWHFFRSLYCCRFWMWGTAPLLLLVIAVVVYPVSLVVAPIGLAFLVYYGGKGGKCGKACMGFSIVLTVLLSILFDVILALLCAIAVYFIGLIYIYCCMPLALVLQNTPDIDYALRDLEQGR